VYAVRQRRRELGVRIALGAQKHDVLGLVLYGGLRLTLQGVAIGLAGAFALTRFLLSQLYSVEATDPVTFLGLAVSLTGVALLACWLPARRASQVDPMMALRGEG
jgi:putative ABC transport system permease protein